jgi:threonine/homoserine/homoserine lactone efflux protein
VEFSFLLSGVVFGLSAGFAPGPLTALVISETLKYTAVEGAKVALSPLITDLPIILFIFLVLSRLSGIDGFVGVISICGATFIAYLGYESVRFRGADFQIDDAPPHSIRKGVIANFLNPNPYLFWFTIGAPTILEALGVGLMSAVSFVLSFYTMLVGSKMLIAAAVGRSRGFLKSGVYVGIIRGLGLVLFVYAGVFLKNGLISLGMWGL